METIYLLFLSAFISCLIEVKLSFFLQVFLTTFALGNNPKPDISGLCMTEVLAEGFFQKQVPVSIILLIP
jgi:hypothetical protein